MAFCVGVEGGGFPSCRRHWSFRAPFLTSAAFVLAPAGSTSRSHVLHVTAPELAARHLLDARVLVRALGDGWGAAEQEPWDEVVLVGEVLGSSEKHEVEGPAWADDALRLAILADTPPDRELEWSDGRYAVAAKFAEGANRLFTGYPGAGRADRTTLAWDIATAAERLEGALRRRRLNTAVAAGREIVGEAGTRAGAGGLDGPAQELIASLLYSLLPGLSLSAPAAAGSQAGTVPGWPDDLAHARAA